MKTQKKTNTGANKCKLTKKRLLENRYFVTAQARRGEGRSARFWVSKGDYFNRIRRIFRFLSFFGDKKKFPWKKWNLENLKKRKKKFFFEKNWKQIFFSNFPNFKIFQFSSFLFQIFLSSSLSFSLFPVIFCHFYKMLLGRNGSVQLTLCHWNYSLRAQKKDQTIRKMIRKLWSLCWKYCKQKNL